MTSLKPVHYSSCAKVSHIHPCSRMMLDLRFAAQYIWLCHAGSGEFCQVLVVRSQLLYKSPNILRTVHTGSFSDIMS